ncbi:MAG: HlyD family efflux transporter periplasmic adaptor subunit [Chloroflexota bacterium]
MEEQDPVPWTERLRSRWAIAGAALLVLLSAACVRIAPMAWSRLAGPGIEETTIGSLGEGAAVPTVVIGVAASPTPAAPAGRQVVPVQRGTISELLTLVGRVAGAEEVALSLPAAGRVANVAVKPSDGVEAGQVLLETDTQDLEKEVSAARARLETSSIRLKQAQEQAQARQRETDRRNDADRARKQNAVAEAEAALRRAQADLERVKAGASQAEREAAEGAVTSARANLGALEAELTLVTAGPTPSELRAAEQQVTAATLALQRAEADFARLKRGPDPVELRAAESAVLSAQTRLDRAQADLERLTRDADPYELRSAERDVARAQNSLRAAEALRTSDDASRAARDAAVANAQLSLQDAQDRLARVKERAKPAEVEVAKRTVEAVKLELEDARARLQRVRQGPDQLTLDVATAAVESSKLALDNATSRLEELQAGPSADRITAATYAVEVARSSLAAATARLADLNSHPTPTEIREAEDRLALAQTALNRAQADAAPLPEPSDPAAYDLLLLEKGVQQDRAQVETLERQIAAGSLRAPFAGVVAAVLVRAGDPVAPGQTALLLAKPGDAIVRVDLTDKDAAVLAVGQPATVQLEVGDGQPIDASVAALSEGEGVARTAQFQVSWAEGAAPALGSTTKVAVTLQQKEDVLLVPEKAIRSAGDRRYVEHMDDGRRRLVDVEVGIIGGGDAEIVSGLTEGQLVLVSTQ